MEVFVVVAPYGFGIVLIAIGLGWARSAVERLGGAGRIRFVRHWGGLGAGEGGWEIEGAAVAGAIELSFAFLLILLGVGLVWPRGGGRGDRDPAKGSTTAPAMSASAAPLVRPAASEAETASIAASGRAAPSSASAIPSATPAKKEATRGPDERGSGGAGGGA